jgi:ATP-dependent DNA ligase
MAEARSGVNGVGSRRGVFLAILKAEQMHQTFQLMPLSRRAKPFNHPEGLFELKYDGFRALARVGFPHPQQVSLK